MLCYAFVHLVERLLWATKRIDRGAVEMLVLVNVKCARWLLAAADPQCLAN